MVCSEIEKGFHIFKKNGRVLAENKKMIQYCQS